MVSQANVFGIRGTCWLNFKLQLENPVEHWTFANRINAFLASKDYDFLVELQENLLSCDSARSLRKVFISRWSLLFID